MPSTSYSHWLWKVQCECVPPGSGLCCVECSQHKSSLRPRAAPGSHGTGGGRREEGAVKEDRIHTQHNGKVLGCRQATHSSLPVREAPWVALHATHMQRCNGSEVGEGEFSPPTSPTLPAYLVSHCSKETRSIFDNLYSFQSLPSQSCVYPC